MIVKRFELVEGDPVPHEVQNAYNPRRPGIVLHSQKYGNWLVIFIGGFEEDDSDHAPH